MSPSRALALFWFFYFGALGVYVPYFTLYLRENAALSGTEVGIILAIWPLVGIFAQPLWGQVADRTGARAMVLAGLSLASAAGFLGLDLASDFRGLASTTAALAIFGTAVVPVSFSIGFAALRAGGPRAFGWARMWGTVGFLGAVVIFPRLLDRLQQRMGWDVVAGGPTEPGLQLIFPATAALAAVAAVLAIWLPRAGDVALRAAAGDWRRLLHHGPIVRLLLFSLAAYVCLQGPTGLFPIFVRDRGGSMETVGNMWIFMLLLEIPLVAFAGIGVERFGARSLLAVGVVAGGLRWALCALNRDVAFLYPIQMLHGVVVAGMLIGGPMYLEAVVPAHLRSTGQVLLSVIGPGFGGVASNLAAGWLLDRLGIDAVYMAGGLGAVVLGLLVPWVLPAVGHRQHR